MANNSESNNSKNNNSLQMKKKSQESSSLEIADGVAKDGIFKSVLNARIPLFEEHIYNQPCFVLPSKVKDNLFSKGEESKFGNFFAKGFDGLIDKATFAGNSSGPAVANLNNNKDTAELRQQGRKTGNLATGFKAVIKEILSFILFNPFMWWYYKKEDKDASGNITYKYKWGTNLGGQSFYLIL